MTQTRLERRDKRSCEVSSIAQFLFRPRDYDLPSWRIPDLSGMRHAQTRSRSDKPLTSRLHIWRSPPPDEDKHGSNFP
jgi:hypothetical protein